MWNEPARRHWAATEALAYGRGGICAVVSREEFDRLLAVAPMQLKPILLTAYYTGMRRGELLKLTWDGVDLKAGVLRLCSEDTTTQEGRLIPLTKELTHMLQESTIYLAMDG